MYTDASSTTPSIMAYQRKVNKGEYFSLSDITPMSNPPSKVFLGWWTYEKGTWGAEVDITVPFLAEKSFTIRTRYA